MWLRWVLGILLPAFIAYQVWSMQALQDLKSWQQYKGQQLETDQQKIMRKLDEIDVRLQKIHAGLAPQWMPEVNWPAGCRHGEGTDLCG